MSYTLKIIAAMTKEHVIGVDGKIPWKHPSDLKRFKNVTTGKTVIMGRKTHESIGKALPNRRNIILSRTQQEIKDCEVFTNIDDMLSTLQGECYVIGGGEIYNIFMPLVNELDITWVPDRLDADTISKAVKFPSISQKDWYIAKSENLDNFTPPTTLFPLHNFTYLRTPEMQDRILYKIHDAEESSESRYEPDKYASYWISLYCCNAAKVCMIPLNKMVPLKEEVDAAGYQYHYSEEVCSPFSPLGGSGRGSERFEGLNVDREFKTIGSTECSKCKKIVISQEDAAALRGIFRLSGDLKMVEDEISKTRNNILYMKYDPFNFKVKE